MTQIAILPAILCSAFFSACAIWVLFISFTPSDVIPIYEFAGVTEYTKLLSGQRWWLTIYNLLIYGIIVTACCLALSYVLATIITRGMSGANFAHFIIIIPLALSPSVTGEIWKQLLGPSVGLQHFASNIGFPNIRLDWVAQRNLSLIALSVATIWQQLGICISIIMTGILRIDRSILEALDIDAAPAWRRHFQVIIPTIHQYFLGAAVFVLSGVARTYDLVMILTSGGPAFSSDLPSHYIIEQIFERQDLGLAAAGSTVMLAIIFAICAVVAIIRRWENTGQ